MRSADSRPRGEVRDVERRRSLRWPRIAQQTDRADAPGSPAGRRRRLDLGLLAVLVALDDHRSVSAAAVALGMSQPQVSVALGKLRDLFNDAVFVRTSHGMQPTPRAVSVVKSARGVLAQIDQALSSEEGFDPATAKRPFVFAISDTCEIVIMPYVLSKLRAAAPNAVVRSVSLSVGEVATGLESGQIDLAIGYLPDLCKRNFFQQTLFVDGYVTLVRSDHPVSSDHFSVEQFLKFDHALVRAPIRHQELLDRYLARKRIHYTIGFCGPHVISLPSMVAQSDMIMTIPTRLAEYFLSIGAPLRKVQLPFTLPTVEVRQYWHAKFQHDTRSKWLRTLIADVFHDRSH